MNVKITFLIGSLLLIAGCKIDRNKALLFHSDFEEQPGVVEKKWTLTKAYRVDSCILGISENAHSGKNAFEISRVWCDSWSRAGIETSEKLPVQAGKNYLLNFWYKTENVVEYALPLVVQFRVERQNHEPLMYGKSLSWSEFQWREAFLLLENLPPDALSVQLRFYTRFRIKGSLFIDDVKFYEASANQVAAFEKWRRQDIPKPAQALASAHKTEKNGYFRLMEVNNRWWFVRPDGSRHWSIGTMAAMPGNSGNGNTEVYNWYRANYSENPEGFAEMLFDSLKNWGFNSYAGWTSDYFARISENNFTCGIEYFPMFKVLGLARMGERDFYARDRNGLMKEGEHSMVDPFNPSWQKEAREKAKTIIPEYRDKAWFAGWYVDNEIDVNDLFKFVWAEFSGKEFVGRLKNKYLDVETLNKKWSSPFGKYSFNTFDEILDAKPEPKDWDDPLYVDFVEFERVMIEKYIEFTYNLVKEFDPNHLVISNRINLGPMSDLHRTIDLWAKFDLICMNIYPQNLKFGFSEGELAIMKNLHEGTGKPIIIGEWSVPAMSDELYGFGKDPFNRPLDWSWPQVVRNQQERGEVYKACMFQLASLNFVVGAGWFKPIDINSPVRRANRGLINGKFQPYFEMIDSVKIANQYIIQKFEL